MRGRALLRGATGLTRAREIAGATSWQAARDLLDDAVTGPPLPADADRSRARAAAATATIWQLRVLAGWVPPVSSGVVRVAAGPVEIADIEGHVAALAGPDRPPRPSVALGSLATAWPRVAASASADAVRDVLRRSVWGDPGGTDPITLALGLRVAWVRRVRLAVPEARPWALGALAVLVAREHLAFDRRLASTTARDVDRALGHRWSGATTVPELAGRLPPAARWPLVDVAEPDELWRAERTVLHRVVAEAGERAARGRGDRGTVAAILALLLIDLWRVRAAIDLAGRGTDGRDAFDAVAA
jgi:hypothetical protein